VISDKGRAILLKLYDAGSEVTKSFLLDVVPNSYSLERNLESLVSLGLITMRQEVIVRRTYFISLTNRGRIAAIQLRRVEDLLNGTELPQTQLSGESNIIDIFEMMPQIFSVRAYDDHIILEDLRSNERITILMKNDDKGIQRLWCEKDQSFACIHARYSWTLPEVQMMYFRYLKKIP
jgi:DNA-binding MarR family transcriptional regulator